MPKKTANVTNIRRILKEISFDPKKHMALGAVSKVDDTKYFMQSAMIDLELSAGMDRQRLVDGIRKLVLLLEKLDRESSQNQNKKGTRGSNT